MTQPGYRRINQGLLPNATTEEKIKYELCQSISRYARENGLTEKELVRMVAQQPPTEPINITTTECEVVIFGVLRTVLKISPHCWKRNEEFRQSKKKKVQEHLDQYLLSKKEIRELVQQINEKE
ncbi:10669_t:CDS:2, partial [Ambispora leptoticha]